MQPDNVRHNHALAHAMVQGALTAVANQTASENDRALIVQGAILENTEVVGQLLTDNVEMMRTMNAKLDNLNGSMGNGKTLKDRAKQAGPPVVVGAGAVGLIVAFLERL